MALVGVIMGSSSDFETLRHAVDTLAGLGVSHECEVVSAHRTPERMVAYAKGAAERGVRVIIAGAGGAAHLPGMVASLTSVPVLGVPIATESSTLRGVDALLSIVQMPAGVPVATFAIGRAGAVNAALFAAAILAGSGEHAKVGAALAEFRRRQTQAVLDNPDPRVGAPGVGRPGGATA